jgi:hypothetical protein
MEGGFTAGRGNLDKARKANNREREPTSKHPGVDYYE